MWGTAYAAEAGRPVVWGVVKGSWGRMGADGRVWVEECQRLESLNKVCVCVYRSQRGSRSVKEEDRFCDTGGLL
jgi:hypothetical protein